MKYPNFIYGSYKSQSITADQELTMNWYVERMESQGATTDACLFPTPGVTELSAATNGPGRAHIAIGGREFAVLATDFVELDANGLQTVRGTVAVDDQPATISSNGDGGGQLFITSGGNGYNYDLGTNTLTQIAALNGIASMGAHLGGYFINLDANNSTIYISNLLDGTTWDTGVDFAQRSLMPDPWISMRVSGQYIWLIGEQTSEVWYLSGDASFPFSPAPSGLIYFGTSAAFSAATLGRELIWIGASKDGRANILKAAGFSPEVISNYPIQNEISQYTTISDAIGDSYSDRGHNFYILHFPTAGKTWVWDSETKLWAERGTWIAEESRFDIWRPIFHAFAFNEHRMLDSETGSVYRMDQSIQTDVEDRPIRRVRRAPALMDENERVFYSKFELDLQPGVGTGSAQAENPQVMMRISNDGGRTWGAERMRSAGKVGEYSTRLEWHRCGAGRRRVFEISTSDPVPYRIAGAYLTLAQQTGGNAPANVQG